MRCYVLTGVSCRRASSMSVKRGIAFRHEDKLHIETGTDIVSRGDAINDDDRAPWLSDVGLTRAKSTGSAVV